MNLYLSYTASSPRKMAVDDNFFASEVGAVLWRALLFSLREESSEV